MISYLKVVMPDLVKQLPAFSHSADLVICARFKSILRSSTRSEYFCFFVVCLLIGNMYVYYMFVLATVYLHVFISRTTDGNVEGQKCAQGSFWHEDKKGSLVCCKPKNCTSGHFVQLCSSISESTCERCPNGTFRAGGTSSLHGIETCTPFRPCSSHLGLIEVAPGNRTQDSICKCDLERGFYDIDHGIPDDGRPHVCVQKSCGPDTELSPDGSCKSCPDNTSKEGPGYERCVREEKGNGEHPIGSYIAISFGTTMAVITITLLTWYYCIRKKEGDTRKCGDMEMTTAENIA